MKKILSLILSLLMISVMCVTVFAATEDIILTYDLTSGGENDIVVQTGDIITVAYSLSASEKTSVSVTQNEIYYDHTFFEIIEGSNKGSAGFTDYTTTLQERLSGKRYVYFNTIVTHTHDTTPSEIGTFQLKVIATEGESTVSNVNYMAFDTNAVQYGAAAKDLHVSIGKPQTQKFTVIFNNEDGSAFETITVENGETITLPEGPSKSGYTFSHWSIGGDTTKYIAGNDYTPASDVTFTPNWTKNEVKKYTLVFNNDDGSVFKTITVEDGETITIPNGPSKSGYTFSHWSIDGDATKYAVGSAYTVNGNVTFKPNWIKNDDSGSGVILPPNWKPSGGNDSDSSESTYIIEAYAADGGSISPSGDIVVVAGGSKTFYIEADAGYEIKDVLVDDESVGAVSSYTFKDVDESHTIYAVFEESAETKDNPFVDVSDNAYYYDAVIWASENGITTGATANTFDPDGVCTRAQAVTFLWRAAGKPTPKSAEMPFVDVSADAYYYDAVLWAVENGITKGTSDTTFSPGQFCTRAHIVTFLWRAYGTPAADADNPFVDVAADAYYHDAVLWAVANGITNGTSDTAFSPDSVCTRAQIVTFMYRAEK